MKRLDKWTVVVKAIEDIDRECLVIPVFYRRGFGCLRPRAFSNDARWKREVTGRVQWKETGVDPHDRGVEVLIHCQPERKLPAGTRLKDSDYDLSMDCHPFWHIRRSNTVGEFNCEIVTVEMKDIGSSTMKELQTDWITPLSCIVDFTIKIPCIRNTEEIAPGAEIVLKWETKKNTDGTETAGVGGISAVADEAAHFSPLCLSGN